MLSTIGNIVLGIIGAGIGLYVLWQIAERIDRYMIRRRRAKTFNKSGGDSICRWGFNAKGELGHVRTRRTP